MAVEVVDKEARFGNGGRGCLLKAGGGLYMAVYGAPIETEQYWYPDITRPAVACPYTIPESRWVRNAKALGDGTYGYRPTEVHIDA